MGSFGQNLMFASFGFLSCGGITPVMALGMAGIVLLASAAQFFLLFKKRRSGWLPVLFVAAALLCSFLEYLAISRGWFLPFFSGRAGDLLLYAAVAAVYLLPGIQAGWLAYLAFLTWRKGRS